VTHGPAEPHQSPVPSPQSPVGRPQPAVDAHDAAGGGHGHGHGAWHGPHESPAPMTWPLMALAVGALVAGFVGIPAALGGGNAIEHFLEPSFTASHEVARGSTGSPRAERSSLRTEAGSIRAGIESNSARP